MSLQETAESDYGPSDPKRPRMDILWELCIICQTEDKSKHLRENPIDYEQVLNAIHTRGKYGDGLYPEISRKLTCISACDMKEKKATWHKECFKHATSKLHISRAKARYENEIAKRAGSSYGAEESSAETCRKLTRRSVEPYNNELCFFCQKADKIHPLLKVSTDTVGQKLRKAVELSKNEVFRVRLSTAIDPKDAHAIDVRYHSNCFAKHVRNVLRRETGECSKLQSAESELAAEIEFIEEVKTGLQAGEIQIMNDLAVRFKYIRENNGVENPDISNKRLKQLLSKNIDDIQFSKPARLNESERVTVKKTSDRALQMFEETEPETDMRNMFDVAKYLRKQILEVEPWKFSGSLNTEGIIGKHVPKSLIIFLRWLLQGSSRTSRDVETTDEQVQKRVLTLAQHIMYNCLTRKQCSDNKKTLNLKHVNEWPLQLGVGLTVHATFRSKELIAYLHGLGLSVDYKRIISVETQIANQAVVSMYENNGVFVPRNFVPGRHIFFAVDNCDFQEDTPDGKNTLHGTVMNIYQSVDEHDETTSLAFDDHIEDKRLYDLPDTITEIAECNLSNNAKPECPELGNFPTSVNKTLNSDDLCWLLAAFCGLTRSMEPDTEQSVAGPPTWSALNSIISKPLPLTRVSTPPLIAAPAHEFSTLLTVLKQAQGISAVIVGEERKTVISLDMGLYKPAQKLLMAKKNELSNIVLRPGELHVVIAMLRTIGSYIDSSGIDTAWLHADLYGQTTIKQIIDGNHVKRGVKAHTITLLSLFSMNMDAFSKHNDELFSECKAELGKFIDSCSNLSSTEKISEGYEVMQKYMTASNFETIFSSFNKAGKRMHQAMLVYMRMVMLMLEFIKAVRNGDWVMHLNALEQFTKYFFAKDRLNYARMIPLYLSEMLSLQEIDPTLCEEFASGNWVVNKSKIAFCALGADHALEQVNRWMKVAGGIVGITQNQTARTRFFLVAPELARLKVESKQSADVEKNLSSKHYELTNAARTKVIVSALSLTTTLQGFTNPFEYDGDDIINIVTKAVVAVDIQRDIETLEQNGSDKFDEFVESRLKTKSTNFWDPMKKLSLKTWKTSLNETKLKVGDKTVELKEDRGLFARMLIVANSRPEISLEDTIGTYELSVVPRALFAADGSMHHCSEKSQLMAILEKQVDMTMINTSAENIVETDRVAIVDAMVIVQSLDKPKSVKTCKDLSDHFCTKVTQMFDRYETVHLIFDRYDVERSLKTETRSVRLGGKQSIAYHIADSTRIENVSMKTLLSHSSTKDELSVYFSTNLLEKARSSNKSYVIAYQNKVISTTGLHQHLASNQEEADTKLILHATFAYSEGALRLDIHSADTDVLVLCLGHFERLPEDTVFVTGSKQRRRKINLSAIRHVIGDVTAKALIGFHALSGADVTGSMSGKGKISCWQAFSNAGDAIIEAFCNLGSIPLESTVSDALEGYVCKLYQPDTTIMRLTELRWWMFRRKQAESHKLPPTRAAFHESLKRAQYQCIIWKAASEPNPDIPVPENYGWKRDGDKYIPVMTTLPPAPDTLLQLVKCGCSKTACETSRCKCKANNLFCTDLCVCGAEDDMCKNVAGGVYAYDF